MKKTLLNRFVRDHLFYTIVFFASNFLIALFYYILVGNSIEWLYPASIALFVYIIFITYRWITYKEFNLNIQKLGHSINFDIKAYSCEEKELVKLVTSIHQSYMKKMSDIQFDNKTKKHLMSQWIHNMKTPVSVVDLILQKTYKGEMSIDKAMKDIQEENRILLDKLEQILNYIRLEDFNEDYVPEVVDLTASVRNVINNRKNQFIYSMVYPKFDEEKTFKVLTDEKWNESMIDQIISNAIKYSRVNSSPKKVYFSIQMDKDKVVLSIKDEGVGIPKHDLNRIFNPFFTGDNGRDYDRATGIGLYFCSQVAKKLGHELNVESKIGVGTEIKITYLSKL